MSIERDVVEKLRNLPEEQQREVLEFVDSLKANNGTKPRRSFRGLWKAFKIDLTEQDISNARREMWAKFSRNLS